MWWKPSLARAAVSHLGLVVAGHCYQGTKAQVLGNPHVRALYSRGQAPRAAERCRAGQEWKMPTQHGKWTC